MVLYLVDLLRWGFLFFLADSALLRTWHAWRLAGPVAWLRWSVMSVAWAVGMYFALIGFREQQRVTAMGRDLRQVSSWATPFRHGRLTESGIVSVAVWFGGLVLLLVFFRR